MSKLQRVVLEYDDKIMECSGEEAEKFGTYLCPIGSDFIDMVFKHINWGVVIGGTPEAGRKILEEDIPVGKV